MYSEVDAGVTAETTTEDVKQIDAGYAALTKLIEECQMDTGITDLAHQHDHYLYGTPKKPDPSTMENK